MGKLAVLMMCSFSLAACIQESDQSGPATSTSFEPVLTPAQQAAVNLPTLPPRGKIDAQVLVNVFAEDCLQFFPDNESASVHLRASGMKETVRNPYASGEHFTDSRRGISVDLGDVVVADAGPNESSIYLPTCTVSADVTNPDADWDSLTTGLTLQGSKIRWSAGTETSRSGFYKRDGQTIIISIAKPVIADAFNLPTGTCGKLPDCYAWTTPSLSLQVQAE